MERNQANSRAAITDYGARPLIVDMKGMVTANNCFRRALWTGKHLQVTLMSIPVRLEIGPEVHPHLDQLLVIEEGCARVEMGQDPQTLHCQQTVGGGYAVLVPAGSWHNVVNVGSVPLRLFSVYAPPQHPFGTVHRTKAEADAAEGEHGTH